MGLPSPATSRAWGQVKIGDFKIPPTRRAGTVTVSAPQSMKIDRKKKAGADKSKDTVQGRDPVPVKVKFEFTSDAWDAGVIEPIVRGLAPDGQPRDIEHPNTDLAGVKSVLFESTSGVSWVGCKGSIEWSGNDWTEPEGPTMPLLLRRGSKGPEVTRWQTFLRGAPTSDGVVPTDGFFGASTETATKTFQTAEKIRVDGIAGPETFGAASRYGYAPPPPVAATGGSATRTPGFAEAINNTIFGAAEALGNFGETTDRMLGITDD